jgi:glycosyltransferase involved in cell wall biosynthesis
MEMILVKKVLAMHSENNPKVAVYMITYNHEPYIAQAIESILMQKTNFKYKIYVGEDCSTDNTKNICKEFKKKHPEKIDLILHASNIGANVNAQSIFKACFESGADYIAMLEGDDYWTDPLKLQKQVDLLEANNSYGLVYTNYRKLIDKDVYENDKEFRSYQNLDGYFRDGCPFLFTGSWLMKNEISNLLFLDNKYCNMPGDVQILCHVLASKYQVHYHNETTGVYRILEESASHSLVTNKDKDFALVRFLLLMKYKNNISKHILTEQLGQLIQNKFQYFESFRLGLIGRIGLFVKVAKVKGVNRASRFVIYNVS